MCDFALYAIMSADGDSPSNGDAPAENVGGADSTPLVPATYVPISKNRWLRTSFVKMVAYRTESNGNHVVTMKTVGGQWADTIEYVTTSENDLRSYMRLLGIEWKGKNTALDCI
jgi:hypothetical protein